MTNKWNRCTGFFAIIEGLIGLLLAVLGVIFERNRAGVIFSNAQQEKFAHLVLSYGCLLLLIPLALGLTVLMTFRGFLILSGLNAILSVLSIAWGVMVIAKPLSALQHGFVEKYLKVVMDYDTDVPVMQKTWIKFVLGAAAIVHGLFLMIHAIATLLKRRKVKPHFRDLKKQAAGLQGDVPASVATRQNRETRERNRDTDTNPLPPRSPISNNEDSTMEPDPEDDLGAEITTPLKSTTKKHFASDRSKTGEKEFDLDGGDDEGDDNFSFNGTSNHFDPKNDTTTTTTAAVTSVASTPSIALEENTK